MRWCLKSPASRLFTQPFIQAQIKENVKAQRHWPLCGEFNGDRWQRASNAENVSIWWRLHDVWTCMCVRVSWTRAYLHVFTLEWICACVRVSMSMCSCMCVVRIISGLLCTCMHIYYYIYVCVIETTNTWMCLSLLSAVVTINQMWNYAWLA